MDHISTIKNEIKQLQKQLVVYKDPTKLHYNIGDIVWVNFFGEPTKGKIDEIQDFNKNGESGAYIFYWVIPVNRPKIKWVIHIVKFQLWNHLFYHLGFKPPKVDFKFGPGHAVLAGRDEDIFDSEKEANYELSIQTILHEIDILNR